MPATTGGTTPEAPTSSPVVSLVAPPILEVTAPPVVTSTSAPFVPFAVTTWADNVLLRANPGHLFQRLSTLSKGTSLQVLGRSPGAEWLLVQTGGNSVGWVFTQLVEADDAKVLRAPEIEPQDAQHVMGRVLDPAGRAISGIQFAIVQGEGSNAPRTDAMTDETGIFHAFMPLNASGTWWVGYTAISCESNRMSEDCSTWVGEPAPKGMYIELPQANGTTMDFVWQ